MSQEVIHRLGMVVAVALGVLCACVLGVEVRRRRGVRRRASIVLGGAGASGSGARPGPGLRSRIRPRLRPPSRRGSSSRGGSRGGAGGGVKVWAGPLGVAGFVAIVVGGAVGLVVGLAVGYGAKRWLARQRLAESARLAEVGVRAELAPVGDLLAACLAAGAGPRESAEAVGRSLDGTVAERLRHVAAELRLGAEPAVAWRRLAVLPGAEGLARCMERAGISGVPAVESASRIAAELRAESGRTAAARARRAGVLVTLPLSACFLPAFLTLGVAPVLMGLAGELLGRG